LWGAFRCHQEAVAAAAAAEVLGLYRSITDQTDAADCLSQARHLQLLNRSPDDAICSSPPFRQSDSLVSIRTKGAITTKLKHAIKIASPARLAQLLQPSLAFCFSLQPMTAH